MRPQCIHPTHLFIRRFVQISIQHKEQGISWGKNVLEKEKFLPGQPPERIELSTPGLQDQCSNHWAMEAHMLY